MRILVRVIFVEITFRLEVEGKRAREEKKEVNMRRSRESFHVFCVNGFVVKNVTNTVRT
jgi:hypothetical protein